MSLLSNIFSDRRQGLEEMWLLSKNCLFFHCPILQYIWIQNIPTRAQLPIPKGHYALKRNMFETQKDTKPPGFTVPWLEEVSFIQYFRFFICCSGDLLSKTTFRNKILKGLSFVKWERAIMKGETSSRDALPGKSALSEAKKLRIMSR